MFTVFLMSVLLRCCSCLLANCKCSYESLPKCGRKSGTDHVPLRRRLEAPAGRAVRLVRFQADDDHRNDFVDVIWGWTRAWHLVISREDALAHHGVPALHG